MATPAPLLLSGVTKDKLRSYLRAQQNDDPELKQLSDPEKRIRVAFDRNAGCEDVEYIKSKIRSAIPVSDNASVVSDGALSTTGNPNIPYSQIMYSKYGNSITFYDTPITLQPEMNIRMQELMSINLELFPEWAKTKLRKLGAKRPGTKRFIDEYYIAFDRNLDAIADNINVFKSAVQLKQTSDEQQSSIRDLQYELQTTKSEKIQMEVEMARMEAEKAQLEAQKKADLEQYEQDSAQAAEKLEKATTNAQALQDEIREKWEATKSQLDVATKELEAAKKSSAKEVADAATEQATLNTRIQTLQSQYNDLANDSSHEQQTLSKELENVAATSTEQQDTISQLQDELQQLKVDFDDLSRRQTSEQDQQQKLVTSAKAEIDSLRSEVVQLQNDVEAAQVSLTEQKAKTFTAEKALEQVRSAQTENTSDVVAPAPAPAVGISDSDLSQFSTEDTRRCLDERNSAVKSRSTASGWHTRRYADQSCTNPGCQAKRDHVARCSDPGCFQPVCVAHKKSCTNGSCNLPHPLQTPPINSNRGYVTGGYLL